MIRTVLLLVTALASSSTPAVAQVDPREDEDFSNSAFVRTSDEVKAELFFARRKTDDRDWGAAVHAYQAILDRDEPALVEFTDRLFLSAHEAARRNLTQLPEEARARYRDLFDVRAEAARQQAMRLFDPDRLVRVAQRYPLTSAARRALEEAAVLAAERGDVATLTRVLRLQRRTGDVRGGDVARLAHALADAGDRDALEALRYREEARHDVPVEGGGTLAEVFSSALARLPAAVDPEREHALATAPIFARPLAQLPRGERVPPLEAEIDALGYAPIRFPSIGLADTGGALWIAGLAGLYRPSDRLETLKSTVAYSEAFDHEPGRWDVSTGNLRPTVDGERLLLVLNQRERSYFSDHEESSQIVCFDARDARTIWRVRETSKVSEDPLAGVIFEGPPAVHGDVVLVAGSRLDTVTECSLFAFDRETGTLRWSRFLASATKVSRFVTRNRRTTVERAEPSRVVVSDGIAYCSTNLGVVAAVDSTSGEVLWLFRYNRVKPSDPDTFRRISYYDTGGWLPSSPEVVGERLVVAPEDSHFLYVLARMPSDEGHVVGPDPLFKGGREMFIGVDRTREELLFLEQPTLGVDRARVRIGATRLDGAHREPSVPLQIEEQVMGRPAIVGDALFLSTNKALYRFRLDAERKLFDSIPVPSALLQARERFVFGNLSYDHGRLYSISPLAAFEIAPK